ncbi:MAG: NAD(P)(+) transhydrogenase (Re/Si-specific) subunit beta [Acidimicrobiales bacterium]|nr:NAD(P)(+) transhydrogenase (Re/Si-specific) subunit beta [Acidimicrobiales bacterium]
MGETSNLIQAGYILSAVLFVLGLKGLGKPRTAVRGNALGAAGMLMAVVVTLTDNKIVSFWQLGLGLVVGALIGGALATQVQMTGMPELVALFNGFGGLASVLVVGASFLEVRELPEDPSATFTLAAAATALIGAITFSGSVVAYGKLRESFGSFGFSSLRYVNGALMVVSLALGLLMLDMPKSVALIVALVALGFLLGVSSVVPIGGADMPVVIALLNSLSGLAASATGFALGNSLLIIAGSLVGASGLILTQIMCVAMNRTLSNVLFSAAPVAVEGADADETYVGKVTSTSADEVALLLENAERVAIVPGYGMAVAQAQHAVRDLAKALEANGTEVVFGIHPVAGRMPGHMNVLLAEAEIDYEKLIEMDVINSTFAQTDMTIVIGANDVVNPVARQENSPISGMPILDVDRSQTVVIIKRSLSPGFAGIPNPLFAADNALMLFGDGKEAVMAMTKALSELSNP